jgi:hypothetical protein
VHLFNSQGLCHPLRCPGVVAGHQNRRDAAIFERGHRSFRIGTYLVSKSHGSHQLIIAGHQYH